MSGATAAATYAALASLHGDTRRPTIARVLTPAAATSAQPAAWLTRYRPAGIRPPITLPPRWRFVAWLGVAGGTTEAAVRVQPRLGLSPGEIAIFLVVSTTLSLAFCVVTSLLASSLATGARRWPIRVRPDGLVLGAFLGMQAAANYRFEAALNASWAEPRAWAACLGLAALGVTVGWIANPRHLGVAWLLPVVAAGVAFGRALSPVAVTRSGPGVLLVSMDTTRADAVGEGATWQRLAREGVTFTQAIAAAPITEPSHLSMLTGMSAFRAGIVANGTPLRPEPALLWRAAAGAPTAAFVAGFPLHSKYGWAQGIHVYDDDFGAIPGVESLSLVKAANDAFLPAHARRERGHERVLARAVPWLRAHRDGPFFAFVHFYDPHAPYDSGRNDRLPGPADGPALELPEFWPAPFRAIADPAWLRGAYALEVAAVDAAVGKLLDALGPALDRTVVVVTADHGETFQEHTPIFDHGDTLYDEVLRVPLAIRYPPVATPGLVVECQVGSVDIAPTVRELADLVPVGRPDGISRVPELKGWPCRDTPVVAATVGGRHQARPPVDYALRAAGSKLIAHARRDAEAYDLDADPGETRNLAPGPESEGLGPLLRELVGPQAPVYAPSRDDQTTAALEALGYSER
jgi:arylsulfatase A-like enzyme